MNIRERFHQLTPRRRQLVKRASVAIGLLILAALLAKPLIAWFSGKPMGGSTSRGVIAKAGDLNIEAALRPDPPRQSDNMLLLKLTAADQKVVEDADVEMEYVMPAMGAMAEMRGNADVDEKRNGVYHAAFDLPMGGTWTLEVRVQSKQASGTARFTMTVGSKGLFLAGSEGGAVAAALPPQQYPPAVLDELRRALGAYELVREMLANDQLDGIGTHATTLAVSLRTAKQGTGFEVMSCLEDGAAAADEIAAAKSLPDARAAFKDVSRYVFSLAASDRRLAAGWHAFACSMTDGFNKWLQRDQEISNPYMGLAMQSCGTGSSIAAEAVADSGHIHGGDETAHYTCSMHPSVKQETAGTCPICSMDLIAVSKSEIASGVIRVDEARRQKIGVKTAMVISRPMATAIRAVGKTAYDESRVRDITLKLDGFIERLYVDTTGQYVRRGQPLLALYSPDLYAAQQEYLLALRSQRASRSSAVPDRADYLVRAARQRLRLWDFSDAQIDQVARTGRPLERMSVLSPYGGFVIEKRVVEGSAVKAGERVFRIAALDRIWVEADIYEKDLGLVRPGQTARVTLPYMPGRSFTARVTYVYPYLDPATRTGKVRLELPNPAGELKPEMYADVELQIPGGSRLMVPEPAVIQTGPRQLVFLDLGEGRLKPQQVQVGRKSDGYYEVLSGLKEGDRVIASANFLIASESRIRAAEQFWGGSDEAGQ
ncbi:MAG TPA: efflux RND transporter periplasmic adaptor subunit [Thermoanaerobaculia bacterium]|nr:efflux RND transporter periplasmic adaptor subunit [Thermoanaerobaculia bacterium]